MYREHVTVRRVSFRRRGTAEILDHVVITDVERPFGQAEPPVPAAPALSLVTDAGMPSTTQCHQPEPVGASGSNKVTAKFLVCAGKPDHDSEGEMFLPVMPNPSKTWFRDIIWVSATSSLRSSNDGTAGMKS